MTETELNSGDYSRPAMSVTADLVVLSQDSSRILLIQRLNNPFKNCWALPGGFVEVNETIETAASRELLEETALEASSLTFVGYYDTVDRDARGRILTMAFLAYVKDLNTLKPQDDAKDAQWFDLNNLPDLAFDHNIIIQDAIEKLSALNN